MIRIICLSFLCFQISAQQWTANINLNNTPKHTAKITIGDIKNIHQDTLVFQFAKVIPGTYSNADYARFIVDFKAFNSDGKRLKVKRNLPENNFVIYGASNIQTINYNHKSIWHHPQLLHSVFPVAGSCIAENDFSLLNNFALLGYFKGFEQAPFWLTIDKPDSLYASGFKALQHGLSKDSIMFETFYSSVGKPIVYSKPDTSSIIENGTQFNISVSGKNNQYTSTDITVILQPLIASLSKFYNHFLIDNYAFMFYLKGEDEKQLPRNGFGALEHLNASVYYLQPTTDTLTFQQEILHVACHEFLHTLTPLSLMSDKIATENLVTPTMSKHLWFYEGVVEYLSLKLLLQDSLISSDDFIELFRRKIDFASQYPTSSLTEMSQKILLPPYKTEYPNIYNKGALLAFCLDIRLLEISNGEKGLKDLVFALHDKYRNSSFIDDSLFSDIVRLTDPSVDFFIKNFIIGETHLSYEYYFSKIGLNYVELTPDSVMTIGIEKLQFDTDKNKMIVTKILKKQNPLLLKKKDMIIAVNGKEVSAKNYIQISKILSQPINQDTVLITVKRKDKEIVLGGEPHKKYVIIKHKITPASQKTSFKFL